MYLLYRISIWGLSRRLEENRCEQELYKAGCIFMHATLNCNLNISGLPLMSNLKMMEFSQTSFAFHKTFSLFFRKKNEKRERERNNSLGYKMTFGDKQCICIIQYWLWRGCELHGITSSLALCFARAIPCVMNWCGTHSWVAICFILLPKPLKLLVMIGKRGGADNQGEWMQCITHFQVPY